LVEGEKAGCKPGFFQYEILKKQYEINNIYNNFCVIKTVRKALIVRLLTRIRKNKKQKTKQKQKNSK